VDNYGGAYEAVDYLIQHGHRRIAIIQGLPGTSTSRARLRGYRNALEAAHLPIDPGLVVGRDFRQQNGYIEMKLLLNQAEPPTAVFATSDLITLGVLQAVAEDGRSIPDDVSLITFDDFDFAPFLKCPLTAVRQPKERMGELAVNLLVETMKAERPAPKRMVLKTDLVLRGSVAAPSHRVPSKGTDGRPK
jgi:DNA-binding LacI/PurR family transcriptional regulator